MPTVTCFRKMQQLVKDSSIKSFVQKLGLCSHQLSNAKNPTRIRILSEELIQLETDYERIVGSLKTKDLSFDPDFKTTISYSDIAILIPDDESAIIEFFPMDDKVVVFVLRNDQDIDVTIP